VEYAYYSLEISLVLYPDQLNLLDIKKRNKGYIKNNEIKISPPREGSEISIKIDSV
jgi:hypothetical protein